MSDFDQNGNPIDPLSIPPPPSPRPDQQPPQQGQWPNQPPPQQGQWPGQPPPPQQGQWPGQQPPQQGQWPGQQPPQGQWPGQQQPPQGQWPGQQPGQAPPPYGQQPTWPPPPNQYGNPYGNTPGYYTETTEAGQILGTSILAFFCFGIILGPWSVIKANKAIAAIDAGRADPNDRGKLITARICGAIATVCSVLFFIVRIVALTARFSGR